MNVRYRRSRCNTQFLSWKIYCYYLCSWRNGLRITKLLHTELKDDLYIFGGSIYWYYWRTSAYESSRKRSSSVKDTTKFSHGTFNMKAIVNVGLRAVTHCWRKDVKTNLFENLRSKIWFGAFVLLNTSVSTECFVGEVREAGVCWENVKFDGLLWWLN